MWRTQAIHVFNYSFWDWLKSYMKKLCLISEQIHNLSTQIEMKTTFCFSVGFLFRFPLKIRPSKIVMFVIVNKVTKRSCLYRWNTWFRLVILSNYLSFMIPKSIHFQTHLYCLHGTFTSGTIFCTTIYSVILIFSASTWFKLSHT